MKAWVDEVGGVPAATPKIQDALGCSYSKAQKVALGCYQFGLSLVEQRELSRLTKRKKDVLFLSEKKKHAS